MVERVDTGEQDRQPSISGEDGLGDNGDEHGHRGDQGPAEWEPCQPGVLLKGHEQQAEGRFECQNTPHRCLQGMEQALEELQDKLWDLDKV